MLDVRGDNIPILRIYKLDIPWREDGGSQLAIGRLLPIELVGRPSWFEAVCSIAEKTSAFAGDHVVFCFFCGRLLVSDVDFEIF